MIVNTDSNFWTSLGIAGLGGAVGVVGTILTALINRQHPMAALVDARIRMLIDGYECRIDELRAEIAKLEQKLDALTLELEQSRATRAFGL